MKTLQMVSLSGNQFDQRGKKFAINQQPGSKLVLKLNYQKVLDRERGGAKSDSILGGVGFYFQ